MSATIDNLVRQGIERDIRAALDAEPALIGSDEGTHGQPGTFSLYETVAGEVYATYSFAGSNATRCSVEEARAETKGRIIGYPKARAWIKDAQIRLRRLRDELRRCD